MIGRPEQDHHITTRRPSGGELGRESSPGGALSGLSNVWPPEALLGCWPHALLDLPAPERAVLSSNELHDVPLVRWSEGFGGLERIVDVVERGGITLMEVG